MRHDDQGVGVERALLGPLVRADEQDVQAVRAVPRRAARRSARAAVAPGGAVRRASGVAGCASAPASAGRRASGLASVGCRRSSTVAVRVEDAADEVLRLEVVVGDDAVGAGDHQADREQAGERERVEPERRPAEPAAAGRVDGVEVGGDPVGVDRRDDPIDEEQDVDDEDAAAGFGDRAAPPKTWRPELSAIPPVRASSRIGSGGEAEGPVPGAGIGVAETGEDQGQEGGREGGAVSRVAAPAAAAASRVGYSEPRAACRGVPTGRPPTCDADRAARRSDPSRGPMFRPVSPKPDLVAQEHEILARWARAPDVRPPARPERRRAALELPRRADHGQQPDGRPPRLGPDLQGPLPALPRDARRGPALAERVRLPGPVGRGQRRARPRLHQQARHRGVRHRRVRQPVQAARPDLRRAPDRAVDPPRDVDGLERPRRAAPAARPAGRRPGARSATIEGAGRPGHRHGRDARRAARDARARRLATSPSATRTTT